jgi:hypothetical protein
MCSTYTHEQTALQRQIESTDHRIDALVYELYGLTEEANLPSGQVMRKSRKRAGGNSGNDDA